MSFEMKNGEINIEEFSNLITQENKEISFSEIDKYARNLDVGGIRSILRRFKRPAAQRIFVNRSLRIDKIEYFGFDMDYTLACYTPEYEVMCYNLIMNRLVELMGYPKEILDLPFDPSFSIRGLLVDQELGNLLKIDSFGLIRVCVHGKKEIPRNEFVKIYKSMVIANEDVGKRYYMLNTLYNTQEACVYANLIEHFESTSEREHGFQLSSSFGEIRLRSQENVDIYYKNLWNDIRNATDAMHADGSSKREVLMDLPKYVERTQKLSKLLRRLSESGKKLFLLTNSPWQYTDKVMNYVLGFRQDESNTDSIDESNESQTEDKIKVWRDYFDIIIVNAMKPIFFTSGSTLREVDPVTGKLSLGRIAGSFEKGKIYSGGNLTTFESMAGIKSGDVVLYVGDHIFSDVLVSKKKRGWRTMLVVPELVHELDIWPKKYTQIVLKRLYMLNATKALIYKNLDSDSTDPPYVKQLQLLINSTVKEKDSLYNPYFGSIFSCGLRPSFFSQQVARYACLYTSHYSNLLNYPMFYSFSSESSQLPHERSD